MARAAYRVALTGGIATGKSYCLQRFAELGVGVIDADTLAHAALAKDTPGFALTVRRFGSPILATDGSIDRAALGRIVFGDDRARHDLEAIVHPVVYGVIGEWFRRLPEAEERRSFRIADIPLLYETGGDQGVDRVVVAACTEARQVSRLLARGFSEDDARRRMGAQLPIEEKRRRADFVIETDTSLEETDRQIDNLVARLDAELT